MPSIEQLEKFLAVEPDDPFVLYALAQAHARDGNHTRAVEYYDRCLQADPNECYAYYHKAVSLVELARRDDAATTLREGLRVAQSVGNTKALGEINALLDSVQ